MIAVTFVPILTQQAAPMFLLIRSAHRLPSAEYADVNPADGNSSYRYSVLDWNEAASYITGKRCCFTSPE